MYFIIIDLYPTTVAPTIPVPTVRNVTGKQYSGYAMLGIVKILNPTINAFCSQMFY